MSTLVRLLSQRAKDDPERVALRFAHSSNLKSISNVTYSQLYARSIAVAVTLSKLGLEEPKVAALVPTSVEFHASFYGALFTKATFIPLSTPRHREGFGRLHQLLMEAHADVILTTSPTASRLRSIEGLFFRQPIICVDTIADFNDFNKDAFNPYSEDDFVSVIQYTSGSTSSPKGVMLRQSNFTTNAEMLANASRITSSSIGVSWLPLFHDMGLMAGVILPLFSNFPAILFSPSEFSARPVSWLRLISDHKATVSGAPGFAYDICVDRIDDSEIQQLQLASWETAHIGAEPIRARTIERFSNHFSQSGFSKRSFFPCYGLAEATLIVSGGPVAEEPTVVGFNPSSIEPGNTIEFSDDTKSPKLVSSGNIIANQKVIIVDGHRHRVCNDGEVGEIWISSPSTALGYFARKRETNATFGARLPNDRKRYLRTGDLGFVYEGKLYVTGRIKDLIIVRGANLYPQDLELAVEAVDEAIKNGGCAVFSCQIEAQEELVIVAEVTRNWRGDPGSLVEAILKNIAREYGVIPYDVVLIRNGDLPRTSSGKIQRYVTRERYLARLFREFDSTIEKRKKKTTNLPGDPLLKEFLSAEIHRLIGSNPRSFVSDALQESALDSIQVMQLRAAIQSIFGILVDLEALFEARSIAELATRIEAARRSGAGLSTPALVAGERGDELPLSYAQERLWV
ncbi:AMP-binding protein, partial [Agrobacterium rhizogenes]|nr:AMP-binding protein [Rhizobium rhizogenes]